MAIMAMLSPVSRPLHDHALFLVQAPPGAPLPGAEGEAAARAPLEVSPRPEALEALRRRPRVRPHERRVLL